MRVNLVLSDKERAWFNRWFSVSSSGVAAVSSFFVSCVMVGLPAVMIRAGDRLPIHPARAVAVTSLYTIDQLDLGPIQQ